METKMLKKVLAAVLAASSVMAMSGVAMAAKGKSGNGKSNGGFKISAKSGQRKSGKKKSERKVMRLKKIKKNTVAKTTSVDPAPYSDNPVLEQLNGRPRFNLDLPKGMSVFDSMDEDIDNNEKGKLSYETDHFEENDDDSYSDSDSI